MLETLIKHRRYLHQIPEIGFDLFKTHQYIKEQLISYGYDPITVAHTGLIAVKHGKQKAAIAFRADMDALMVDEKTMAPYTSAHPGRMHACGHDGHMAMLLGFAEHVAGLNDVKHTVVFIFQPAEEGPGGAKNIIDEGWFETLNIKRIYGFHLYPNLMEHKLGLVNGPMMAQNGEFDVVVKGKSAHGAQPHLGSDAILAASWLITQYQTILSRHTDPLLPGVVTVGTIEGGEARNIIANQVKFSGTVRAFHEEVYETIKRQLTNINHAVSTAYDVQVEMDFRDYYPAVVNDASLFEEAVKWFSKESVFIKPMMFAEDFAFYQKKVPGFFMMLGTMNAEKNYVHPLHSCFFNFDESVLLTGVNTYVALLNHLSDCEI